MKFSQLSANEKLDAVLDYLYKYPNTHYPFESICAGLNISTLDTEEILEAVLVVEYLLLEDRLIYESEGDKESYRINFRGKKFKEDGGYRQKEKSYRRAQRLTLVIEVCVAVGTIGAMIGSFAYVGWTVWAHYHPLVAPILTK